MNKFITPSEIELTIDDFDFKIIKIGEDIYGNFSFEPYQNSTIKINNTNIKLRTHYKNIENFFEHWNFSKKTIEDVKQKQIDNIKFEAVLKYINSKSYIRKMKLEKIKKNFEKPKKFHIKIGLFQKLNFSI